MRMTRAYLRIYSFNIKAGNSKTVLIINPINIPEQNSQSEACCQGVAGPTNLNIQIMLSLLAMPSIRLLFLCFMDRRLLRRSWSRRTGGFVCCTTPTSTETLS